MQTFAAHQSPLQSPHASGSSTGSITSRKADTDPRQLLRTCLSVQDSPLNAGRRGAQTSLPPPSRLPSAPAARRIEDGLGVPLNPRQLAHSLSPPSSAQQHTPATRMHSPRSELSWEERSPGVERTARGRQAAIAGQVCQDSLDVRKDSLNVQVCQESLNVQSQHQDYLHLQTQHHDSNDGWHVHPSRGTQGAARLVPPQGSPLICADMAPADTDALWVSEQVCETAAQIHRQLELLTHGSS